MTSKVIKETYGEFPTATIEVIVESNRVRVRVREPSGKASICLAPSGKTSVAMIATIDFDEIVDRLKAKTMTSAMAELAGIKWFYMHTAVGTVRVESNPDCPVGTVEYR